MRSQQEPAVSADAAQASGGAVDPTAPPTPGKPAPQAEPQGQPAPSATPPPQADEDPALLRSRPGQAGSGRGSRWSRRRPRAGRPTRSRPTRSPSRPRRPPRRRGGSEPAATGFYVKVVAYRGKAQADKVAVGLSAKGYSAYVVPVVGQGPDALQRARRQVCDTPGGRRGQAAPRTRGAVQAIDCALALLSGVLLALSVPRFGHPAIAWVALSPLLASLLIRRSGLAASRPGALRAFSLGLVTGVAYFVGTTSTGPGR